jgi:DNA topoisomerase IB
MISAADLEGSLVGSLIAAPAGRDAKGRKQYRYHARFPEVRESTKYEHVVAFADALPSIREKVREHMALRGLPREKVRQRWCISSNPP